MECPLLFNLDTANQIIIPLFIFFARIIDVTLQTIRIISVSRGVRLAAAIFGFFEVLIWLIAITQIMQNLTNVYNYIAYAGGFAMGNFIGISIEKMISSGSLMIRIITNKDAAELVDHLISMKYGVTSIDAVGSRGPVKVIFTIVKRKEISKVVSTIKKYNPQAFYTIEDIRFVTERQFIPVSGSQKSYLKNLYKMFEAKK